MPSANAGSTSSMRVMPPYSPPDAKVFFDTKFAEFFTLFRSEQSNRGIDMYLAKPDKHCTRKGTALIVASNGDIDVVIFHFTTSAV